MLTIIQRRIARDLLVTFLFSLFVITVLVMFIGVMREAFNQGLGVIGVVRLLPYALPNALSLAVPGTALFSVCCVYGRMSADNELTALQSVGISPMPAMWPAIIISTCLSVTTVGLINVAFTWGYYGIQQVVMSSVENVAYRVLERDRNFQSGPLSLTVRGVEGRKLIEPIIKIRRNGAETVRVDARSAVLRYDDASKGVELSLTNGSAQMGETVSFHFPDTFTQVIPLNVAPAYDLLTAHPSHMPMHDLPVALVRQKQEMRKCQSRIAVHAGFSLMASRPEAIVDSQAMHRHASLASSQARLHRLDTEIHRRWASGFTCLAMSMIGIPLAIRLKTSDTMTTFGIVFFPTVLVYYPVFALTLDMAKDGRIAPLGVWIANGIFVFAGILMMRNTIYKPA